MNLAHRLRPTTLSEFVGQHELVGDQKIIRRMVETGKLFSLILWGPPGSGKTTLATIIAKAVDADFHLLSAVTTGKEDLQKIITQAKEQTLFKKRTILFLDEIHRWNKAQQDVLLPFVETGLITLIGATTENPSFEVNSALLSRCKVFVLKPLSEDELSMIINRALTDKERGLGEYQKTISKSASNLLIRLSLGDGRAILNALEIAVENFSQKKIDDEVIKQIFQTRSAGIYDKKGDEHYNIISAFIKSMRGCDADASLYYLTRMLENGEDPKFIARRMMIFASEDIGLSDKGALIQANAGFEAVTKIGMPEAKLILAHICLYLAKAPKSRTVTNALAKAQQAVYEFPNEPIPFHLRNAPTKLMKGLGYSQGYSWSDKYVGPKENMKFLPEKLQKKKFFEE